MTLVTTKAGAKRKLLSTNRPLALSTYKTKLRKNENTNTLAYFDGTSATKKKFYNIETWAQCYKTFSICNLRIFVIS